MREIDWRDIDERHLEAYRRRVALIETLLDESTDKADRLQERLRCIEEHGVSEQTIRNYLRRYRERGAEGLLFYKSKNGSSLRVPSPPTCTGFSQIFLKPLHFIEKIG